MLKLVFKEESHWPPLAWLARCRPGSTFVEISHGSLISTRTDWFHEAVWAGDFEEGDFDQTDLVFGSGGRVRGDSVVFVSPASTLDRLQSMATEDTTWVSNSLPCLCAAAGVHAKPSHGGYIGDLRSITHGLDDYKRELETTVGHVRFTYFHNLQWDGKRLSEKEKPNPIRDFSSFTHYRDFLATSISRLAINAGSRPAEERFSLLGTLSTGYDSPAVTALAVQAGLKDALCFGERPEGEDARAAQTPDDTQREIAKALGVRVIEVSRDAWQRTPLVEVPFIVGDSTGMDIWLQGGESELMGRLLLTGNHGDGVWSKKVPWLGDQLRRKGAISGLSLTEYRLWAGFIHCPVPYMGARQIEDIQSITVSEEMKPWDVGVGYSRPIPRRIAEHAGIPRDSLGILKRGTSIRLSDRKTFSSSPSAPHYLAWLRTNRRAWLVAGRMPPTVKRRLARPLQACLGPVARWLRMLGLRRETSRIQLRLEKLSAREPSHRFIFPWALERAMERYEHLSRAATASSEKGTA